jgi:2,6-dihydroxypseudooxynicotine hydrolase
MADTLLAETLRDRLPRLYAAGVDHNDIQTLVHSITHIAEWPAVWEALARDHEALAEAALTEGRLLSAAGAFQSAALYHHFGQFVYVADPAEKQRMQRNQAAAFRRAAPYLAPPAEQLVVRFEGIEFPGNLRLPPDVAGRSPCVLLNPGADSTKEEFHTLENTFLARGVATFSYDGPGQGLTWASMKLRPDYEAPIGAVVDRLQAHGAIDPTRIGIWGRSFGAYCALRGARDPRIRACISIGGFYDMGAIWSRMPKGTTDSISYAFGQKTLHESAGLAQSYTLAGQLGQVSCPVLVVHSGQDNVCPVSESQRMIDELGAGAELAVFAEGNHVCDNIPYKVRPMMADWMAGKLRATGGIGSKTASNPSTNHPKLDTSKNHR